MSGDFANDPKAYFRYLYDIATQQDHAKFLALTAEYSSIIAQFPLLKKDIDKLLKIRNIINDDVFYYQTLYDKIKPQLQLISSLLSKIRNLPTNLKNTAEINAFEHSVKKSLELKSIQYYYNEFDECCNRVQRRLDEEKRVEEARQRKLIEDQRLKAEEERRKKLEVYNKELAKIPSLCLRQFAVVVFLVTCIVVGAIFIFSPAKDVKVYLIVT